MAKFLCLVCVRVQNNACFAQHAYSIYYYYFLVRILWVEWGGVGMIVYWTGQVLREWLLSRRRKGSSQIQDSLSSIFYSVYKERGKELLWTPTIFTCPLRYQMPGILPGDSEIYLNWCLVQIVHVNIFQDGVYILTHFVFFHQPLPLWSLPTKQ